MLVTHNNITYKQDKTIQLCDYCAAYDKESRNCLLCGVDCSDGGFVKTNEKVDWEERRYEIAKVALNGLLAGHCLFNGEPEEDSEEQPWDKASKISIRYADSLIKRLREE